MNRLTIILLIAIVHFCYAQNFERQLQTAYDNFDNKAVDSLLAKAVPGYGKLTDQEKVAFHKYKAFRAFQLGEQSIVQNHFRELLRIDPVYTLDPISTSPKLLTLFDKTKIEYLEQQQRRLETLSERKEFADLPWRSLVFPGWEQWHRGSRIKGYSWMALGTITLAGTVQALVRTSIKHEAYLDEEDPVRLKKKYHEYNDVYQSQYYWAYSMLAVWIASHVDAVFLTENKNIQIVTQSTNPDVISLGININL